MRKNILRHLSLLALLVCLVCALSVSASAETYKGSCGSYAKWTLDTDTGVLNITGYGEMTTTSWSSHRTYIKSVVIEDGVTNLCDNAFSECRNLEYVYLPESITTIGERAFYYSSLPTIDLPSNLTQIGTQAFFSCFYLQYIEIPGSVQIVGANAFSYCYKLKEVIIHEGVQNLGPYAFSSCNDLTAVVMPDTVTELGNSLFDRCESLRSVELSDRIKVIPSCCFIWCDKLERVILPEDLEVIDSSAFYRTTALKHIVLPEGLKTIADSSFFYSGLEQLILPSSIIDVGILNRWNRDTFCCPSMIRIAVLNPEMQISDGYNLGVPGTTTVYCYPDSTAHQFAVANGYDFEFITEDNLWTETNPILNPFKDVEAGQWYTDSVLWAVDNDITTGTAPGAFSPLKDCTRAQVVTFLWRAAGSPAPKSQVMTFTDVHAGSYYHNAVLWAVEQGITTGTGGSKFSPDMNCSRAQVVTFLYRYAQQPAVANQTNPFRDVGNTYYRLPVLWAVENGITNGTAPGVFSPDTICSRAQIVTFLHRTESAKG